MVRGIFWVICASGINSLKLTGNKPQDSSFAPGLLGPNGWYNLTLHQFFEQHNIINESFQFLKKKPSLREGSTCSVGVHSIH